MKKDLTRVFRLFKANPLGVALWLLADRSRTAVRSAILRFWLDAPEIYLGPGCRVLGGRNISFGRGIHAERNLWLEAVTLYRAQRFHPHIVIGDEVGFSDGVHISSIASIAIGSGCLFGSKVYVSDHNHGIYRGEQQSRPDEPPAHRLLGGGGPVVIGENVWVGDNSVILGPATIGKGAVVGANSVIRGVVPAYTIVAGAPAKPIKVFNSTTGTWDKA